MVKVDFKAKLIQDFSKRDSEKFLSFTSVNEKTDDDPCFINKILCQLTKEECKNALFVFSLGFDE